MQGPAFLDVSVTALPAGSSFLDGSGIVRPEGLEKLWQPLQERHRALQSASDDAEEAGSTSVVTAGAVVPLDLRSALVPGGTVDGQQIQSDTVVLLVAQRDPTENGLWLPGSPPVRLPATGRMKRGDWVFVCAGLTLAGTAFVCTNRRYNGVLEFRPVLARSSLRDAAEERGFVNQLGVGAAYLKAPARPEDEHANRTYLRFLLINAASRSRCIWFDFSASDNTVADAAGNLRWNSRLAPLFESASVVLNSGNTVVPVWEEGPPRGLWFLGAYMYVESPFPVHSVGGLVALTGTALSRLLISTSTLVSRHVLVLDPGSNTCHLSHISGASVTLTLTPFVDPTVLYVVAWCITQTEIRLVVVHGVPSGPRIWLQGQAAHPTAPVMDTSTYGMRVTEMHLHELGLFHDPPDDVTWKRMITECDARCSALQ